MSVKQFYHDVDLVKVGQLVDARIKNIDNTDETTLAGTLGASNIGLVIYNTDSNALKVWDGSAFSAVSSDVSGDVIFQGVINPTNSDTGSVIATSGYQYVVDTAGTLSKTGVTFSPSAVVEVGDMVLFTSGTEATILQRNIVDATTSQKGQVELATTAETDAGTDTARAVTPASLTNVLSDISTNASDITAIEGNIGTIGNLTTTATDLVGAIEELQDEIDLNTTNIGTIGNLTTTATDLVAAIEELQGEIDTNTSDITAIEGNIGTIGNLETAATNLVAAINELHGEINTNTTDIGANSTSIGTIGNLQTAATNLVAAINELHGEINTNTSDITTLNNFVEPTQALNTTASTLADAVNELQAEIDTNTSDISDLQDRDNILAYTATVNITANTPLTVNHALGLADKDFFTIRVCDSGGSTISVDVDSVDVNNLTLTSLVSLTGVKVFILGV